MFPMLAPKVIFDLILGANLIILGQGMEIWGMKKKALAEKDEKERE